MKRPGHRPRQVASGDILSIAFAILATVTVAGTRNVEGQCPNGGLPNGGCTWPNPADNCSCPGSIPNQCFPDTSGPASWLDPGGSAGTPTSQQRGALKSTEVGSSYGTLPTGFRPYCDGIPSSPAPAATIRMSGQRFLVDYDIPNYYCLNPGDWPPGYRCMNDIVSVQYWASTISLVSGTGTVMKTAWAYYENGTWDTGIDLTACGTYHVTISLSTKSGGVLTDSIPVVLTPPNVPCPAPDRGRCPVGGGGRGAGPAVARPINVGSGDVSTTIPLFAIQQSPMPLVFDLTYHSSPLTYTSVSVPEPLGKGWTHPFNQALKPIPMTNRLYHYTADGREFEYIQKRDLSGWVASRPAEARGTITLNGTTHIYELVDLDGTKTDFLAPGSTAGPVGAWASTTDRWGNSIGGTYSAGNLTTITDSVGRQVRLTYSGSLLQTVEVPEAPTARVWSFTYLAGPPWLLATIRDPVHPTTTWRSFNYTAVASDGHTQLPGGMIVLASITDEATPPGEKLLEGHQYDVFGRGVTSYAEGGNRDVVRVEYDQPTVGQSRVTHRIDATTNQVSIFSLIYQGGRWLPKQIDGPCSTCAGAGGDTQSFTYTSDNHVDTVTDGRGNITKFVYNGDGNVISMTEAQNDATVARSTTWEYLYPAWPSFWTKMTQPSVASFGNFKTTTRALTGAGETTLTVTEAGYLTGSSSTSYITTQTFDARHRLRLVDGPRLLPVADTTTYAYYPDTPVTNNAGRLFTITNAVGLMTKYENYDIFGTPLTTTDPNLVVTQLEPDEKGRTKTSTSNAVTGDSNESTPYVTSYLYDSRDRLIKTTLPRLNGVAYGYEDGTNRLLDTVRFDETTSHLQQERLHLTLNDYGNKIQEEAQQCTPPAASCLTWTQKRSEKFGYDPKNRLSQIVHPIPLPADSTSVSYLYDASGLLESVQDEQHLSPNTLYDYDALNRLWRVRQTLAGAPLTSGACAAAADQIATCYFYDAHDNLRKVTDPNGNDTSYTYDDFRRMSAQASPVSGAASYTYDEAGNLSTSTDANGAVTTRIYDAANRVTSAHSAGTGSPEDTTWTYDSVTAGAYGLGRLALMTDPSGSTTYAYERRGLLRSEGRSVQVYAYTLAYGYDANGNRKKITYPSGMAVDYTFDFADRPFSASSGSTTFVSSATYAPFGPEMQISYGNGTTRVETFDLRYRPFTLTLTGASQPVSYTYGVDALGNITSIADGVSPTYSRTFGYDDLNRLTTANSGSSLWGTGTYAYDAMGNMKSLALGAPLRAATFSYLQNGSVPTKNLPKLSSVTESGLNRQVLYDNAGNEKTVGAGTFNYSPRNSLAAGDGNAYTYDGRGLRAVTTTGPPPGAPTNVAATFDGASVSVTWVAPPGGSVDHYEVWRLGPTPIGSFVLIAPAVTTTTYTDSAMSMSTAYVYKVNAVGIGLLRSPDSNLDLAYTGVFVDDPLVVHSTLVRLQHILDLRQAVAAVRLTAGLTTTWPTNPPLGIGALVSAAHIQGLRSNLDAALPLLSLSTTGYTDDPLAAGVTIKAIHIQEIRAKVK